nr:hypothetical protein [Tanacetum cinerariifolium]
MDNIRAQQKALDDELVAPTNRLKIGKINLRLSSSLKSKESTLQVALDALKLTLFYNAFNIFADVPEIYMQEFWVTVSRHHSSLRFKLNGKSHTVNVDNFRDTFKICPKLPSQIFEEPPSEEEILSFIRDLGYTDLVFQVENKNSKKNNDMYYPRFTKVIVDYFMTKDQAIPRRNKMFWHYAKDDFMFTIPNSESSPKMKPTQASKGKRIKTSAKGDKPVKMKQSAIKSKGLTMLSKAALSEPDQIKLATNKSKKEFHSSHASSSGDGVDIQSKVPDEQQQTVAENDEHDSKDDNDEHDSANDNDDEDDDQENVSGETKSDDDEDAFIHPNLSTYNADDQEEEDEEEKAKDDDEVSSDQGYGRRKEDEEDEELYEDLNVNLDRRDVEMTDDQLNQETKELYVTLSTELPVVQKQSSSVSSDLVVSSLESELSELKQTNQFVEAVSSISGIVDNYLGFKIKDAVNVAVQLQSNKLRKEAQDENDEFLKQFDSNIEAIIKDQVKAQTSYAATASLSEFELKKILIDKIKENKSMHRSDVQKNLYNALIESYNLDKDIFASYGDVVTLKRGRDDQDKDEEPFAGSNRGTKQRRSSKEESSKEATKK